ncbi:adenylosuccinate lyase [Sulfurospirillum barnesii]|uniref:DnaJ-class molecular chaperone with C-terminal Zn finger domain n=1 Tax=Sulfurospirillum barnesii (strain ATCC 700032 / DSM 10660 / SES-3) TaxID=760154 RepID=I3XX63_SULBS|nr:adenylosuccinate lyase [Sulfurospirillum barnesii]AFL68537.1 DnaJ-class molecular chaperone with C-terminal Zn finger domain [Sulfurospirillum barnesii SES-3]
MHLSLTHDMLAITIEEDSKTFYYLQNIADKNFKKKIGRKEKMIIFKEEDEIVQRRYFLKLLSKIYLRKTNDYENAITIEEALEKSIKISLLKPNQLLQKMNIQLVIEDNYAVVFHLGSHNTLFASYLKSYFKDHLVRIRPKNGTITLYPNSDETVRLLEKLLEQKELFGCFVAFNYQEEALLSYKKSFVTKRLKRSRHNALFSLLEEYFGILGCKVEDSFEMIRRNYLSLVKKYHPDSCGLYDGDLHVKYVAKFQEIQYAYEMLKMHFRHAEIKIA